MRYVLIGLLKLYRLVISPLYGNVCRYYLLLGVRTAGCRSSRSRSRQLAGASTVAALPSMGAGWVRLPYRGPLNSTKKCVIERGGQKQ